MRPCRVPLLVPLFGLAAAALAACAAPARTSNMAVAMYPETTGQRTALSDAVLPGNVTGGRSTFALWMPQIGNDELAGAIRSSLAAAGWLAPDPASARYALDAELIEVDKPMIAVDSIVTTRIGYRLTDRRTGGAVWSDEIETRNSQSAATGLLPEQRQRLALEGAVRENLTLALQRLRAFAQGRAAPVSG